MPLKDENKTRTDMIERAKERHAEKDLQNLFNKWDRAIALAPASERVEMARLAILEVQSLLDIHPVDGLTINDEVVIPAQINGK